MKRAKQSIKTNKNLVILSDSEESQKENNRDSSATKSPQNDKVDIVLDCFGESTNRLAKTEFLPAP